MKGWVVTAKKRFRTVSNPGPSELETNAVPVSQICWVTLLGQINYFVFGVNWWEETLNVHHSVSRSSPTIFSLTLRRFDIFPIISSKIFAYTGTIFRYAPLNFLSRWWAYVRLWGIPAMTKQLNVDLRKTDHQISYIFKIMFDIFVKSASIFLESQMKLEFLTWS